MIALLKYWKYAVMGLLIIAVALLYAHGKSLKADLVIVKGQLAICQATNKTMQITIASLQAELKQSSDAYEKRLSSCHVLLSGLKQIDDLQPNKKEGDKPNETTVVTSGDPILDALNNGLWNAKADSK